VQIARVLIGHGGLPFATIPTRATHGAQPCPGSPTILIHTRQGKIVGIYCDQPAKVLEVETQDSPNRTTDPRCLAFLSTISPQTSVKVVGGCGSSVAQMLAMLLDDPSMDNDLCEALYAHEIVLSDEWPDIW